MSLKKKTGKVKKGSYVYREDYANLVDVMDEYNEMVDTAVLHDENPFIISFSPEEYNKELEKKLEKLRSRKGIDFDFSLQQMIIGENDIDSFGHSPDYDIKKKRLVMRFYPDSEEEWEYIKELFGFSDVMLDIFESIKV